MVWEIIQTVALGLSIGFAVHQQMKLERIEGTVNGPVHRAFERVDKTCDKNRQYIHMIFEKIEKHREDEAATLLNHCENLESLGEDVSYLDTRLTALEKPQT